MIKNAKLDWLVLLKNNSEISITFEQKGYVFVTLEVKLSYTKIVLVQKAGKMFQNFKIINMLF